MQKDNKAAIDLLKTAKGQLDAVIKMTEDERYCVDIAIQINAVLGLLKKANLSILKNHLETCVLESFEDGTHEEKIAEMIHVIGKYT
jgi:DNA-binding FrmR family transcriptional regulator